MYHFEVVSESFFFEVAQSGVGYVIHGSVLVVRFLHPRTKVLRERG